MCRRRRHSRSNHPTITFAPIYPPQKYNRHEFGTMQYSHANTAIHTAFRTQHSEPMKYTSQTYPDRDEIKTGPPPRYSFDEKRPLSSYNQPQTQAAHAGAEHHMAWADMPDDSVSRVNKYDGNYAVEHQPINRPRGLLANLMELGWMMLMAKKEQRQRRRARRRARCCALGW